MKKKKKQTRRNTPYSALDPHLNLRTRYEEIEDLASYAHTLSDEDKAWLNSFAEEEINANFNHTGIRLNDPNDAKTRSRIYNRNNARNRCILSREMAMGTVNYLSDLDIDREAEAELEETIIDEQFITLNDEDFDEYEE